MEHTAVGYQINNYYLPNPPRFGDVSLLQIGRRYCKSGEHIKPHVHLSWYEITIVTNGRGTITTNGVSTPARTGDVYLSFPCDIHEIRADKDSKLEYDFFSFFLEDGALNDELKSITRRYWGGESRIFRDEKISRLVENAIAEISDGERDFSKSVLTDILHLIIVYLVRDFNDIKQATVNASDAELLCFRLMNYIDTNVYSLQKLDELGPKFNYSYGYLSGLFKKTTGKTISEYYHRRKMESAKALILERKKKISEIAEMLGYSPYAFSKAFKAEYGISPKMMQKE